MLKLMENADKRAAVKSTSNDIRMAHFRPLESAKPPQIDDPKTIPKIKSELTINNLTQTKYN